MINNILGYVFGLHALLYALSALFIGWLARKIAIRYITQGSFLVSMIGLLLLGPSKVLGFPKDSIVMTLIGISILGTTTSTVFVPLLSDIIDAVEEKEQ